jgi:hypothetical protein
MFHVKHFVTIASDQKHIREARQSMKLRQESVSFLLRLLFLTPFLQAFLSVMRALSFKHEEET